MKRPPDFLIIGAYKSGTTSLLDYLGQHPQVFLPALQEPNFFAYPPGTESASTRPEVERDTAYRRPRTRTQAQYDALFVDAPATALIGECSPEYMRSEHACGRIAAAAPHVKLLAVLRNPVDRAYSDYQAFVRDGLEPEPFATAIKRPYGTDSGTQYVATGFYGAQLRPYYSAFPAGQIKVILTSDLVGNGPATLREVGDWLGLDTHGWDPDVSTIRNVSGRPANAVVGTAYQLRRRLRPWLKPWFPPQLQRVADQWLTRGLRREAMDLATRARLVDVYRDDIILLERLIDRDLSGWLATGTGAPS